MAGAVLAGSFGGVVRGAVVEGAAEVARGRSMLGAADGSDLCTSRAIGSTRRGRTSLGAAARLVKAPATVGTTVGAAAVPPLGAAGAVAGRTTSRDRGGLTTATPFSDIRRGSDDGQFIAAVRPTAATTTAAAAAIAGRLRQARVPRPNAGAVLVASTSASIRISGSARTVAGAINVSAASDTGVAGGPAGALTRLISRGAAGAAGGATRRL
ncbi:hypothetical protein, partial [Frankia sp. CpI1-P]|uniref:hypothetical protein n=1 Tax=Frankia sp. CpI1-P TaxID=1502734 RepID=UPI0037C0ED61